MLQLYPFCYSFVLSCKSLFVFLGLSNASALFDFSQHKLVTSHSTFDFCSIHRFCIVSCIFLKKEELQLSAFFCANQQKWVFSCSKCIPPDERFQPNSAYPRFTHLFWLCVISFLFFLLFYFHFHFNFDCKLYIVPTASQSTIAELLLFFCFSYCN